MTERFYVAERLLNRKFLEKKLEKALEEGRGLLHLVLR
jgi:hypothetical protein